MLAAYEMRRQLPSPKAGQMVRGGATSVMLRAFCAFRVCVKLWRQLLQVLCAAIELRRILDKRLGEMLSRSARGTMSAHGGTEARTPPQEQAAAQADAAHMDRLPAWLSRVLTARDDAFHTSERTLTK